MVWPKADSGTALQVLQLLTFWLGAVILIQWITAADHAVPRRGGAVAKRATDHFGVQRTIAERISQYCRIT